MQDTTFIVANAPSVDWITAGSSMLGVILGAGLSYFVTWQFEHRRIRDDRLAKSYSLIFALMKIADDLTKIESDIHAALAKAKLQGVEGDVWTKLTFGVGYSEPITIPPENLTVVALTRDQDLTIQISEVESAHRIYLDSIKAFRALQEKFETFGLHTAVEGETVTFEADDTQSVQIGPTLIQLRSLSQSICASVPAAAEQARAVSAKATTRVSCRRYSVQSRSTKPKASSQNSCTVCISPVAIT